MAEELAASNQPAELVTTQAGHVVDAAALGLGETIPTPNGRARGADGKAVLLLEVDRRRLDPNAVDGHLQLGAQNKRAVRITESCAQTARIKTLVDAVDANADVALLRRNALGHHLQLVGLELGAVAILGVGEAPCGLVIWPARFHGEAVTEVADRRFAALTVLSEQPAAAFG